ncbi:hypothetical protein F4782DRAFT_551767 [Xylaria castorea]|nr:hypothetical protein F4782DRAFT_551767 [Xylaria castorea]
MCRGSRAEMLCGHVDTHFSSPCGKKCSSPQGVTRYLDKLCPRCDPENTKEKRKARTAELMSQLRHGENQAEIENLTERGNQLNVSMRHGIAEARHMMFGASDSSESPLSPVVEHKTCTAGRSWGARPSSRSGKAPWDPDSDSESDDGRRDTSYLTGDGKQVVQKQYKLISGHWALIAYRKELHEVDPYLLAKLRDKRKRELAKVEAKERKREEKRPTRHGEDKNIITNNEEDSKIHHEAFVRSEKKAVEKWRGVSRAPKPVAQSREKSSEPSSPRGSRGISAGEQQGKKKTPQKSKGRIHEERYETRAPLVEPETQKTHKYKSSASPYPPDSFRARAVKDGFHPTVQQWGVGSEEYEREPVQAESSGDPVARRDLRGIKRRTRVGKFAEDITYSSTDSSSDADSVVTVLKIPVHQSGKKSGKSTGYGESRSQTHVVGGEEDLDMWHKIADEE